MRLYFPSVSSFFGRYVSSRLTEFGHELVPPILFSSPIQQSELAFLAAVDVVFLDLTDDANERFVTEFLSEIKSMQLEPGKQITLVGISSVMSWNCTGISAAASKAANQTNTSIGKNTNKKLLKESNYKSRKCSLHYKSQRMLESLLLAAHRENAVHAMILASGILYGNGENSLLPLFQSAWLNAGGQSSLPVIGDGSNLIPLLHIADFAAAIRQFIESPPPSLASDSAYIVCVDQSSTSQLALVRAISKAIGNGEIHHLDPNSEEYLLSHSASLFASMTDIMTLDLKFENELLNSITFEWTAESGLVDNADSLRKEFLQFHRLKPQRLWISGPPAAGNSTLADRIGKKFYLPVIRVGEVIKEALERKDELADRIAAQLAESQAALNKKGGKKSSKAKNSSTANPSKLSKGAKVSSIADLPEYESARIGVHLLTKLMKRKLRESEQRNKGFILDNYPRNSEEAIFLFATDVEEDSNGEPIAHEFINNNGKQEIQRDPTTNPAFIVRLECDYESAANRCKMLNDAEIISGHNTEDGFKRRWARYSLINSPDDDQLSPFLYAPPIEILELTNDSRNSNYQQFEHLISVYISKRGPANNFHPTPAELAAAEESARLAEELRREAADREEKEKENFNETQRANRIAQTEIRRVALAAESRLLIESAAQPLRGYLMDSVIPTVVDGLLEICQLKPDDPVDHLAEYLFRAALKSQ